MTLPPLPRSSPRRRPLTLAFLAALLPLGLPDISLRGADPLDAVDQALTVTALDGKVRGRLSGLLDAEGYAMSRPAPAILYGRHAFLENPRLSTFLDVEAGPRVYGFLQARVDRGFDPADQSVQARLDEWFLRVTLADDPRLTMAVQGGKFATVVGNWVQRHLSWDNPFVNAPLPYENITSTADYVGLPGSSGDFVTFRQFRDPAVKLTWVPIVWGPSYATGLAVMGQVAGHFDFAVEVKNAALSSRPEAWDLTDRGFSHPTFSGRVGWRPDPAWNVGLSASGGGYLLRSIRPELPAGRDLGDYQQWTLAQDFAYAHGPWQVWAEAFESRFEVPRVGNCDSFAYYVEAKYKITAGLYGALRWNQHLFGNIRDGRGGEDAWGSNLWRVDLALGYRWSEHYQVKWQYSPGREHDPGGERTQQVGAVQVTVKL